MSVFYKSATELSHALENKEITSVELTKAVIERTANVDDKVKAYLHTDAEDAIAQAEASDKRRAEGKTLGPLDGIPVSIKDVIAVKDQPMTAASKMLENFVSPYDATSILNLKKQGVVLWGRLNLDEFAMGSSTENSAYKTTSNPWNLDCVPGGSSGGSAACVAAGETIMSLGSDTGGSIRQPAALCGVVGMKPTYGMISRYGLIAFASSLDQIGPFTRTVEDAALLLQATVGHDELDSTSMKVDIPNYTEELQKKEGPWTIGLPKEYFGEGLDSEMRESVEKAIDFYKAQGCEIKEVSLPHTELAVPVYYIIATAEASSNLSRYDGIRYTHRSDESKNAIDIYFKSRSEGFGEEVKRRIILGTYVLSSGYYDAYYLRAQKVRTLIRDDFDKAFQDVDVLLTPTSPTAAFKRGAKAQDPMAMYLSDIYTISVNLAGLPGISVPCGFTKDKLPTGFQLIGKAYQEADLLAVANKYDKEHQFGLKTPQL